MTADLTRVRRLRELFDAVIDLPPDARRTALAQLAGGDAALRRELEEIIAASLTTASALQSPGDAAAALIPAGAASLVGERLGPYVVTALIGMGGMGAVYAAVRADDQYQQRVAIKLMQRDIDSDVTLARFRRERQILATLNHPNIATLLDGGVTPDGRPFLVMEFVDGAPITAWCTVHRTPLRDRLALFRQVCDAVQHAHRNLIIHRDLKPGNILVTTDGRVKLLDFGIAKLLASVDTDPGDVPLPLTRGGARAFTPEYASPEQIRGELLTTASDLYSLGVILFELLTDRRPHVVSSRALVDIERAVLDTPVPRPSSVVTDVTAGHLRDRGRGRVRRRLRGDLDAIVLTALQGDARRRYASVEACSDDVRRYLAGQPVRAHRDWGGYRFRKFVQRNVVASVVSVALLVGLVAGAVVAMVQGHRARAEQIQAQQVSAFLRGLLASVQPDNGRRDVQVSEVLDSAARRIDDQLSASPDVRAELETVIGESYQGLGRFDDAEPHLRRALQIDVVTKGGRSAQAVVDLTRLGELFLAKGELDSAQTMLQRADAMRASGVALPDTVAALLFGDEGSLAHDQGREADAERQHRQALAIQRRAYGAGSDPVALSLHDIAVAVGDQGRLAEAETLARQALAILQHNHHGPDVRVADVEDALASTLDYEGKSVPAESAYVQTLRWRRALLGPDHPDYNHTLFNYSMFIFDQKRYREAAEYSRQILALRGKSLPESHPSIAAALQTLGRSLDQLGDTAAGGAALLESLALRRKYLGDSSWGVASAEGVLGEHYVLLRQYPRAERTLLAAESLFVRTIGAADVRTQVNTRRLVALYAAWHRPALAARYRSQLTVVAPQP